MDEMFYPIGYRVEFIADYKGRSLTGKLGTIVRHDTNQVGWAQNIVELDDGGFVSLYWVNSKIWKSSDVPKPKPKPKPPKKIDVFFAWYDLWIGAYIDTESRNLYICLFPTFVIKISY